MREFVFFLQRADGDIKIGKANVYDFQTQLRNLTKRHGPIKGLGGVEGDAATERALHKRFAVHRRLSSIRRSNYTEWYVPADELLQYIAANSAPLPRLPNRKARTYKLIDE
jgi:hypothetical protein